MNVEYSIVEKDTKLTLTRSKYSDETQDLHTFNVSLIFIRHKN